MPKHKNKENESDEYILRKIKKLEKKLMKRSRKKSTSVSSHESIAGFSIYKENQTVDFDNVDDITNNDTNMADLAPSEIQYINYNPQTVETNEQTTDLIISDLPSTSKAVPEPTTVLDDNILELLGETPSKKKSYSPPIQTELAVRWEHIATTGLSKEIKKDLLSKYFLPENCQKIGAPKLNAEIKAALSETLVKKDMAIEIKQNQQAVAISCISQALTKIFANQNKDADVIKILLDATRLLCDSQYVESMSRRSFVASTIKKDIKHQLYATDIDSYLFGEHLADTLKAAKAVSRSGAEIKNVPQSKPNTFMQPRFNQSRTLNVRPPLSMARQVGVGRRTGTTIQQPRRYQVLPPSAATLPPAISGRYPQPPPPAPPQRSRGRMQTRR